MNEPSRQVIELPAIGGSGGERLSGRAVALIVLGLTLILALVYSQSVHVKPAGDDFSAMAEIQRGNELGWVKFFTERAEIKNYRPLQNLFTWAAAASFPEHREAAIRVLNFGAMASLFAVVLLWAREMGISRRASVAAAVVAGFHPAMAALVCGLDNFSSTLSPVGMWLAAWCAYRFRERVGVAIAWSVPIFVVAMGFKEYCFGLVPLGALTLWWFGSRHSWRSAIVYGAVMAALVAANLAIRPYTQPVGAPLDAIRPPFTLKPLPMNAVLFTAATFLPFNSVWLYLNQSIATLSLAAASMGAVAATVAAGLWPVVRDAPLPTDAPEGSVYSRRWWLGFLLLSLIPATFPTNIMPDVSEVYMAGLIVPVALIVGLSFDGYDSLPLVLRRAGFVLGLAWLIAAMMTARAKTAGVVVVGIRTERMMTQILAAASKFPAASGEGPRVLLLYPSDEMTRRTYSIFAMADDIPLVNPAATDWLAPERKVRTEQRRIATAADAATVDYAGFDVVLVWRAAAEEFEVVQSAGDNHR